jgi:hypothetical protein
MDKVAHELSFLPHQRVGRGGPGRSPGGRGGGCGLRCRTGGGPSSSPCRARETCVCVGVCARARARPRTRILFTIIHVYMQGYIHPRILAAGIIGAILGCQFYVFQVHRIFLHNLSADESDWCLTEKSQQIRIS